MRTLEGHLKPLKAQYFDPDIVMDYFVRFATIRSDLKRSYKTIFDDLLERELPKSSGTSDYEGRGYIKRKYLDQLYEDCRYAVDILGVVDETQANPTYAKPKPDQPATGNEIFISHASKDKPIVKAFVEQILRLGLELKTDHIFCTSLEGMDIRNGTDFRSQIQTALNSAKLVILIITPNYKASEVCQNEMGAAWASGKRVIPFIVEPINYKTVGVLMEPLQIPKLSDATALSKLKDDIAQELGISSTKTDMWDTAKAGFIADLPSKIAEITFPKSLSAKEIEEISDENAKLKEQAGLATKKIIDLQSKYDALSKEKGNVATEKINENFDDRTELEKFKDLAKEVKNSLSHFSRVVQSIVICDYFSVGYEPPLGVFTSELDSAKRKKQIEYDDGQFIVNTENREVKSVQSAITKLRKFIDSASNELHEVYQKSYDSPLELDNQEFWEEHLGLKIPE